MKKEIVEDAGRQTKKIIESAGLEKGTVESLKEKIEAVIQMSTDRATEVSKQQYPEEIDKRIEEVRLKYLMRRKNLSDRAIREIAGCFEAIDRIRANMFLDSEVDLAARDISRRLDFIEDFMVG
jgi:transcription initiation factor TFIIIB Brf1 subunit/transcription initiation factor TFIIB